jgi:hypothetical protein
MVSPGGNVLAGPRAASFEVVATDPMCNTMARGRVDVVGPFVLEPTEVRMGTGRALRFTATGSIGPVRWDVLARPTGGNATLDTMGAFNSGTVPGIYRIRAADSQGESEIQATITVAAGTTFSPRSSMVLVPRGRRVRLGWRGGSGYVSASITGGAAGGVIAGTPSEVIYDATTARTGFATLSALDRYTNERTTLRVGVGEELAPIPAVRGPAAFTGDVAQGDVNGDGRADLVLGHGNRSETGNETGALMVFFGQADGRYRAQPDQVINGLRDNDLFGTSVRVLDVDNDRVDDVVVASPNQDLGRDGRGSVQIFLGSRTGLVTPPERTFVGEVNADSFGTSFVLDDLNGDNAKDLIVAAPNASNPFNAACGRSGRIYVYRATPGLRGLYQSVPVQVIEVRDRLDDLDGMPQCRTASGAGSGMVLLDMDGDGIRDLVLGAPGNGAPNFGSVIIYRGTMRGLFEENPSWVIHTAMSQRTNNPRLGFGLDVLQVNATERLLIVRVPTFGQNATGTATANAGGFFVFRPGTLGTRPAAGTVRVLTTAIATARFAGSVANEGVGRSGAAGDVDGDGDPDYLVGSGTLDGVLYGFDARTLTGSGVVMPATTIRGDMASAENLGSRIFVGQAAMGMTAPVAVVAGQRSTTTSIFGGAVRLLAPGARTPLATRWMSGTWLDVPVLAAFDRSGSSVAIGALKGTTAGDVAVGSPGAHSALVPAMGMNPARPAGFRSRTGAVDIFTAAASTPAQRMWTDRTNATLGTVVVALDFDGDRRTDVAIGDPTETSGGTDMINRATPPLANTATDPCWLRNNTTVATTSPTRGIVRIYLQGADGNLVERFWAIARETVATGAAARRAGFGFSLANAGDVNGDGIEDLLVGRGGGAGNNGAEVIFGRRPDPAGRITAVCTDPALAPYWASRADAVAFGFGVAGIGDIDNDGCAETAAAITGSGRAGFSIIYGYGPLCRRGHTARHEVLVVPDDRPLRANVTPPGGDPRPESMRTADWVDLPGVGTAMAQVMTGGVDLTGDRVPDVVVRDANLLWRERTGPAVEIISGAFLNGLCPEHRCTEGLDERFYSNGMGYNVVGLRTLTAPHRVVIPAVGVTSVRFGAALAVGDFDGDGMGDLIVGAPDDSTFGDFAGATFAWRASSNPESFAADPWLAASGDPAEAALFGASVSVARDATHAWIAIGAPFSSHRGAQTGAAYRWRIER